MPQKVLSRIVLQPGTRVLHIEHVAEGWRVWIAAFRGHEYGRYVLLRNDGSADNVQLQPDGSEDVYEIKPRS